MAARRPARWSGAQAEEFGEPDSELRLHYLEAAEKLGKESFHIGFKRVDNSFGQREL